jgi:hypothetical protein
MKTYESTKEELLHNLPHARSLVMAFTGAHLVYWWLAPYTPENAIRGVESAFFCDSFVDNVKTYVGNDYHGAELRREVRSSTGEHRFECFDGFGSWLPVELYPRHDGVPAGDIETMVRAFAKLLYETSAGCAQKKAITVEHPRS